MKATEWGKKTASNILDVFEWIDEGQNNDNKNIRVNGAKVTENNKRQGALESLDHLHPERHGIWKKIAVKPQKQIWSFGVNANAVSTLFLSCRWDWEWLYFFQVRAF